MKKSVFYHAGCPVCKSAEHDIIELAGPENVEIVNIGENKSRFSEAENAGVESVPALVTPNGNVLHIWKIYPGEDLDNPRNRICARRFSSSRSRTTICL